MKLKWLTEDSADLLKGYYVKDNETIVDAFKRASRGFCFGDYGLAGRLDSYIKKGWFMYSSPILSNGLDLKWPCVKEPRWIGSRFEKNKKWLRTQKGITKGMPISCFLTYVPDTIEGQFAASEELARLSVSGGGVGQHLGMRGVTDKSPGAIPFIKTSDSNIMYYKQGKTRKGAVATYLDISHPDIMEFITVRKPTGGDPNRKAFNIHNAVNITVDFYEAVANDWDWDLISPNDLKVTDTVKARDLWESILDARFKTGEPYINNIDEANIMMPQDQKDLGLTIHGSNLCNEIHLPTDEQRTAVCCLSSLNLAKFDEWRDSTLVEDLTTFLDNVIEYFIIMAPDGLEKAKYSAMRSRDLGIGAMGWHEYLQKNMLSFESQDAVTHTNLIFSVIKDKAKKQSHKLASLRGGCPDSKDGSVRNMHLLAIAPNANSSTILGTSAGIEPMKANAYVHRTRLGTRLYKNPILDNLLSHKYSIKYRSKHINVLERDIWKEKVWDEIISNEGSIQGLPYFTEKEQEVFKTAMEIDQMAVINQSRHRQAWLCQGQSVNVFFKAGTTKAEFNKVHAAAFAPSSLREGVPMKGLYYTRTEALKKGEDVSKQVEREALSDFKEPDSNNSPFECLGCDG